MSGKDESAVEQDRLLEALADAQRRIDGLQRTIALSQRDRARTQEELMRAYASLADARNEIEGIHRSRLWRLAAAYWRIRQLLRPGRTRRRLPAAGPADEGRVPAALEVNGAADAFRFDVVCFPIIDWDFRFQRPQQLMSRFASAGHRVFYVSHRFRQSGAAWEVVPKAENVFEVTLYAPGLNVYRNRPSPGAVDLLFFSLDALRRDLALGPAAAIVQLPFWWPLARRARREFAWPAVYDCMDLHAGFATNSPDMIGSEEEMLREADLVSVSSALLEGIARERNPAVRVVRNACDYDHFAVAPKAPGPRPVVGYYGAISEWFDSDLAADLARRCPDFDFVLIGSTYGADLRPLARLPNVRFVGERPYSEIPGWLGTFDAAILPFRRTPLTEATNPVKAYEIFAAGKPLIAVDLPELRLLEPLVRIASDAAGFERQIRAALAEDPAAASRRQAFARENTWEARRRELAPAIAAAFPRVSIVVVTYENREMNRACLDSIRAVTGWPNLQVVVVDNGSTDGTADDLRARAETGEIVAVLNDANRGFAAANNQGLARADGEYIVLLNNDTVVTRGWLATLVRRLAADASIGLIGPSTNAIGNEAQVDVEYDGLAAMPGWAANFVRANDGVAFTIPMLAMFCVAFPRRVFEAVGPLDERFGLGMFEDDDYSHRVRAAGYGIVCCRDAFVHHWMKASFRRLPEEEYRTLFETNRRLFEEKWGVSWKPHRSAPPPPGGVDEIPDAG